ncbi:predicted protein [Naegleria gruberi]|uniref:Predicted protein n=1 Tax=Naegleria gruberi TaxID=5762 RepID=D2VT41_NAEGR|nr:uncharacterized protein NAEGRDRAFT_72165 [Naegleria gruberi]EFC40017.1 predicted protein [Naegleria gruberi]|eukprot:XP_002672761.1 predicted protein [Naegleria gruberi strain NEG-M]
MEDAMVPYSLRLFKYNSTQNLFELISQDVPLDSISSFSFDLEQLLASKSQKFTIGLCTYKGTKGVVGDLVYAHYPRIVNFYLNNFVILSIYFKAVFTTAIMYEKRPYFTINNYVPKNVKGLNDFVILHSFMQQNGNGLETIGYDDGRKFTFPIDSISGAFVDTSGRSVTFKFEHVRCVY